ncbi:MAG: multidrug ABC transporter substrate-binding protein [Candidatus Portnoybacteria bacterium CG_4_10_14_0_2_um_filter_39_11]|uniref:Multidrug ABC transporter substrate-binding protein n=1 Tax=Candidatus Portnoybacteria bacterium CG_4_10_14_0_2_um_filter_39_11 TaxID=1974797 RepID=A0A2M7UGR7_9BACT|nr:MAG: multidrug ABC transporter substrate-binding protein [Candidatus Portnoybacteria bacterium CG_4_10_14_0_2_um_filter_39_11]
MNISDLFQETYSALAANKVRSGLTILGIVIGIGSVIAMIAIGQGSQSAIQSSIQSLGSNLILVMPGMQRGVGAQVSQGRGSAQTLTQSDADAISQEIALAQGVAPELSGRYQITAKGTNSNTSVIGITASYPIIRNVEVGNGSFISDQNVAGLSKVAVLGPTTRDDLFGVDSNPIGQTVRIKNINFQVIGVTQAKGGSGFNNQDDTIYIPISTAQQFLAGSARVSTISVQAADQSLMTDMQQQITDLLLARHNISDPTLADFSTLNQADVVAAASSVTDTFTMLLGSVAAISLVVGGIGIMNMMLTTVTERTREIGLRKAIGAKRKDINSQFLIEAITLTFLGGIIGVVVGRLVSFGVYKFGGISTKISLSSVILAFSVSAAIGIIFGYYPARRAAGLNPIEALRYE